MNKLTTRRKTYPLGRKTSRTISLVWISRDGRHIPIVEMTDRHLQNAWRLVKFEPPRPITRLIEAEMQKRGFIRAS